jgi:hypothetical protein
MDRQKDTATAVAGRLDDRLYVWCGPVMLVLFLVGIVVAGWLPPPSPGESAARVAHDYQVHTFAIRLGLLIMMFAAAFLGPFAAELAAQIRRMGPGHRAAAYCQLALGALFVLEFIIPVLVFEAAAFRPHRSPAITLALNDLGWIMLVGAVSTAVLEILLIALSVVTDRSETPVFPRWVGSFSIIVGVIFGLGGLSVFFRSGPLAWNGLLAFWIPLGVFGLWILVMTALLLQAIDIPGPAGDSSVVTSGPEGDLATLVEALSAEVSAMRSELDGYRRASVRTQ